MSAKIVSLAPKTPDTAEALSVIDDLRGKVESGEIVAFFIAGFSADDTNYAWSSTTQPATRLRMMGSMSNALWAKHSGDVFDNG